MTDSERLAEMRGRRDYSGPVSNARWRADIAFLLRLLDTTRSERDAALARVGELVDAAQNLKRFTHHSNGPDGPKSLAYQRLWDALAALTPPEYPPEQPL